MTPELQRVLVGNERRLSKLLFSEVRLNSFFVLCVGVHSLQHRRCSYNNPSKQCEISGRLEDSLFIGFGGRGGCSGGVGVIVRGDEILTYTAAPVTLDLFGPVFQKALVYSG